MQKFLIAVVGLILMSGCNPRAKATKQAPVAGLFGASPSAGMKFNAYTTNTTADIDARIAGLPGIGGVGTSNAFLKLNGLGTNGTFWATNGDAPAITIRAPGFEPQWKWHPNAILGYDGGSQAISISSSGDVDSVGDFSAHAFYDSTSTKTRVNNARAVAASNVWDACSIRFWGATGDGVTDDLPALRRMMLSQTNITVPKGIYGFSEPLEITNQVTLSMAAGASFKYIGATNIPYLLRVKGNGGSQNARVTLDGLKLDGGGVLVSNLLEIQNLSYSKLGTVYARNCYGSGIVMADSYANSITPIVTPGIEGSFSSIPSCGLRLIRTVALTVNDPKIEFVTNGISIEHAYETAVYGGTVEYCYSNGVSITDSSALATLEQVHMEQQPVDLYVDYGYKVHVSGGLYQDLILCDHADQLTFDNPQVNHVTFTANTTRHVLNNVDISGGTNGYITDLGQNSTYLATSTTNGVVTNRVSGTLGVGAITVENNNVTLGSSTPIVRSIVDANTPIGGLYSIVTTIDGVLGYGWGLGFHTYQAGAGLGEAMRLTDSGYLGIGTTNPAGRLSILAPGVNLWESTPLLVAQVDPASTNATAGMWSIVTHTNFYGSGLLWRTYHNVVGFIDSMILTDEGALGLGTTNPVSTLDVRGGITSGNGVALTGTNGIIQFPAYGYPAGPTNYFVGTYLVNTNPGTGDYTSFDMQKQHRVSTGSSTANGVINTGDGWAGTTNSSAPGDATTIKAWVNYTNSTGGVFKMPLYQ